MLTGILGLLGAVVGFLPAILQFMTVRANNAQTIALKRLELDAAEKGYSFQVALEEARADTAQQEHVYSFAAGASGVRWVDALAVLVRPYITMWLFHVYLAGLGFLLLYGIANGVDFQIIVERVFDDSFKALVASIIGFWFGDRGGKRALQMVTASAPATTVTRAGEKATAKPGSGGVKVIPAPAGDRPGP